MMLELILLAIFFGICVGLDINSLDEIREVMALILKRN